jgi:glucan phosphoethanolaminetransferase (alkaline phosphatase superfamily)
LESWVVKLLVPSHSPSNLHNMGFGILITSCMFALISIIEIKRRAKSILIFVLLSMTFISSFLLVLGILLDMNSILEAFDSIPQHQQLEGLVQGFSSLISTIYFPVTLIFTQMILLAFILWRKSSREEGD